MGGVSADGIHTSIRVADARNAAGVSAHFCPTSYDVAPDTSCGFTTAKVHAGTGTWKTYQVSVRIPGAGYEGEEARILTCFLYGTGEVARHQMVSTYLKSPFGPYVTEVSNPRICDL